MFDPDLLDTMPTDATPTPEPSPPTRTHHEAASAELGAGYLLCIEDGSSHTVPLPGDGELTLGRDPECTIRLADAQVSRRHAVITAVADGVRVTDLDSRHGTFVNGERVARPRRLLSGDVITLGGAVLVVHRSARAVGVRTVVDAAELSTRLEIELDRTLRYGRTVAVVVVRGDADIDRGRLITALAAELRPIDAAALFGDRELVAVLPELGGGAAAEAAARLLQIVGGGRGGVATAPHDGCDLDTLLGAARGAATAAAAGVVAAAESDVLRVELGDKVAVAADPAMRRLYELIRRLAKSDLPVLVHGETGSGKELAAAAIHHGSARAKGPLVSINCAALPETLAEAELFGHERGAFTGAGQRAGLLESASGGTVFLDEIADLSPAIQAKLLRALEAGKITRLGDNRERAIDIRLVAATHRDLTLEVAAGRFRQDLLFRLNAARVVVPPLRDRRRELILLAEHLLTAACKRLGRDPLPLSTDVVRALYAHRWPGNVRELKNVMDYAAAAAIDADVIEPWHLPDELSALAGEPVVDAPSDDTAPTAAAPTPPAGRFRPIDDEVAELERTRMVQALAACDGVRNRAAALIQMPLRTFVTKFKRFAIQPSEWEKPRAR
ncbi:MAG: sigma 54-interacting transcriptional regulator [Myxococcales bacterium]|nr:sigma 54-interacting transcriptional regulator [Myxococcales bacterium]